MPRLAHDNAVRQTETVQVDAIFVRPPTGSNFQQLCTNIACQWVDPAKMESACEIKDLLLMRPGAVDVWKQPQ